MSVISKLLTGFPALGSVATCSLVIAKNKQPIELLSEEEVAPPPVLVVSESVQELLKKEEYKDCIVLSGFRGQGTAYVCSFSTKRGELEPHFYHLSRSRSKGSWLKKIDTIENKELKFADKTNQKLWNVPFFWMGTGTKVGTHLTPEKDCQVSKVGNLLKLICRGEEVNKQEQGRKTK